MIYLCFKIVLINLFKLKLPFNKWNENPLNYLFYFFRKEYWKIKSFIFSACLKKSKRLHFSHNIFFTYVSNINKKSKKMKLWKFLKTVIFFTVLNYITYQQKNNDHIIIKKILQRLSFFLSLQGGSLLSIWNKYNIKNINI